MIPNPYQAIRHDGGTATHGEPYDQIPVFSQSQLRVWARIQALEEFVRFEFLGVLLSELEVDVLGDREQTGVLNLMAPTGFTWDSEEPRVLEYDGFFLR